MLNNNYTIAVIGGGSWATALIKILSENCKTINWWVKSQDTIDYIKRFRSNPKYLSSVVLDNYKLSLSTDLKLTIEKSDLIILAIPAAFINKTIEDAGVKDLSAKVVYSAIKGIVPEYNVILADYLNQRMNVPIENIGVITGPCHAEEVALEKLSYLTVASQNPTHAQAMAKALETRYIKCSVSDDIYGTEYAAVLKNIFALANGICHGLGYGDNFQAVLISNAIQEIERFVAAVHPVNRDIKSSAYLGDLMVTAYSQHSRNRTFGNMIGKGYSVKSAQMEMSMVAEGYYATRSIKEINKQYNVNMPITNAVYNILYGQYNPADEIKSLTEKLS